MMPIDAPIDLDALRALPQSVALDLLRHALGQPTPHDSRRVFVNRTLRMGTIETVGFDLDWTLADYDQDGLSQLTFDLALDRLVTVVGYPESARRAVYRPRFARRGLMIDTEAGTVLKMNRHRYVGRAFLGRTFLDAGERARLYRREPINPSSSRFYFVDTLFELPEVNLFSELVELGKPGEGSIALPPYPQLFKDVRKAIDTIHADGTLKKRILADLPRLLPIDPELILALRRLAMGGRKLVLITNSEWYYTRALCAHLFDEQLGPGTTWRKIFDLVIVDARKPGFFRKNKPFHLLDDDGTPVAETDVPEWGRVYSGGSREGLMRLLDTHGESILYVGDHIYGDILSSKKASTWRTALVVRELEDELTVRRAMTTQQRVAEALRAELADIGLRMDDLDDVLALYRELAHGESDSADTDPIVTETQSELDRLRAEHKVLRRHAARVQKRISKALNPFWGSLFKQGANKSLFGSQVDDFACIYTSRVSNLAAYGSHHYYRVMRDAMMHDLGM